MLVLGGAIVGAKIDDFVGSVEGDARVEEGGGLQGCEDEVVGVVDEMSVGHFGGVWVLWLVVVGGEVVVMVVVVVERV